MARVDLKKISTNARWLRAGTSSSLAHKILVLLHEMSANECRYVNDNARVHDSFVHLNSTTHFNRLADEGYIDLDEPTRSDSSTQSDTEYNRWIHDAWHDFIKKMHMVEDRPTIQLGDDLQAYCSTHLSGSYYGKTLCTNTFLSFRYVKIYGLKDVHQWKVKLTPVHFMKTRSRPGSLTTTCSCILECCCINQSQTDAEGIVNNL